MPGELKTVKAKTRVIAEGAFTVALSVILKDAFPPIIRLPQERIRLSMEMRRVDIYTAS